MRVVRFFHAAVVTDWRQRDVELRYLGLDVTTVSARSWNEGGAIVTLVARPGEPVVRARTFGRHPYRFVFDPRPLWQQLRRGPVDVLDIHEEPASLAVLEARALARLAGVRAPLCLYSAQNLAKRYPPPFRWFERSALRRAAAVHTCNDDIEPILRAKGFRGMIVNLGLGVDTDYFRPAPTEPRTGLRVGYVGRLEPHKGVEVLVEAMAGVPDATLDITGDGPAAGSIDEAIARHGMKDRTRRRGFVPHEELPERYRSLDVLVVPSVPTDDWVEQFGRVAVEAMACGVAVVASDSGSLREVVGVAGILVAPGDVEALAGALRSLADDPERRRALAHAGVERAALWSWPSIARRQRDLYVAMASGRAP